MFKSTAVTMVGERGSLPVRKPERDHVHDSIKIQSLSKPLQTHINHSGSRIAILSRDRVYLIDVPTRRHSTINLCSPTSMHFLVVDRQQKLIIANLQCIMRYSLAGQVEIATHRSDIGTKVKKIAVNYLRQTIACLSVHAIEIYNFDLKRTKVISEKNQAFLSCCFASDGQYLLALLKSGGFAAYQMNSYAQLKRIDVGIPLHKGDIVCTGLGKVVVASYGKGLFISSQNLDTMKFYPFPVLKVRTSSDLLYLLSEDHSFHTVNLSSKKYKIRREQNPANIQCIQFDIKNDLIAGSAPKSACMFKLTSSKKWDSLDELQDPLDFLKTITSRKTKNKFRKIVFKESQKGNLIKNLQEFMKKQGIDKASPEQLIIKFFQIYRELPDKQSTHPLLLKIPFDVAAFESLVGNSKLTSVPELNQLKDKKLRFQMTNILKALVSLSDNFETHISLLIRMIYPLLCLYKSDITTIQVFLRLMSVYGKGLFGGEDASQLRSTLALCLEIVTPDLYDHFLHKYKTRLEEYLYPSLPVFLVDLLGQDEWLRLMDNLVVKASEGEPEFYLTFICYLMKEFEPKLLHLDTLEEAHSEIMTQGQIKLEQIIAQSSNWASLPPLGVFYECVCPGSESPYNISAPPANHPPPPSYSHEILQLKSQVDQLSQKFTKSNQELLNTVHLQIRREQEQRISEMKQQLEKKDKRRLERRKQVELKQRDFENMLKMKEEAARQAEALIEEAVDGIRKIEQIRKRDDEEDQLLREQEVRAQMKKIEKLRQAIKQDVEQRSVAQMRVQEAKMFDKVNLDEFRNATARQIAALTEKVKSENSDWMNGMAAQLINIKQNQDIVATKRAFAEAEFKRNEKMAHLKQLELLNQQLQKQVAFANSRRVTSQGYLSKIVEQQNEGTLSSHRREVGFILKSEHSNLQSSSWSSNMGSSRKIGYISNRDKGSPPQQIKNSQKRHLREVGRLSKRVKEESASSSSSLSSFDSEGQ